MLTTIVARKVIDQLIEAILVHLVPMRTLWEVDVSKELAILVGIIALLVRRKVAASPTVIKNIWADLRDIDIITNHTDPVTIQAAFGEDSLLDEIDLARLPVGDRTNATLRVARLLLEPLRKA